MPDYGAIGEMLHDARESYNLTCEQVGHDLHIKASYIEALEKGELEHIPSMVYAKGYLRMYAQYLGVNLSTMLNLVNAEAELKPVASVSTAHHEPRRVQMAIILSFVLMLVVAGVWYFMQQDKEVTAKAVVKPVPERMLSYIESDVMEGLSSPCIQEVSHVVYPPCYAENELSAWEERLSPEPLRTVMEVVTKDITLELIP